MVHTEDKQEDAEGAEEHAVDEAGRHLKVGCERAPAATIKTKRRVGGRGDVGSNEKAAPDRRMRRGKRGRMVNDRGRIVQDYLFHGGDNDGTGDAGGRRIRGKKRGGLRKVEEGWKKSRDKWTNESQ